MEFETDRQRGILSPADREYLLGEAEMDHEQSRRNAEARIRQRVVDSVKDFNLLVHTLEPKDRRQIFEKSIDDPAFIDGLRTMLSFVYLGLRESGVEFGHVLEPAIRRTEEVHAVNTLGRMVDVTVEFDVETQIQTEIEALRTRLTASDPVTPAELFSFLIAEGDIPEDIDTIVVQLETDSEQPDEFVSNIVEFLDAEVDTLPMNRIRLTL